jgi:hypothetical protein
MHNIIILTPVAPGTIIAPCSLPYPRLISELAPSVALRECNININRARLQRMFMTQHYNKYDFVLLMDSDVVVPPNAGDELLSKWKPGTTPCINTKGNTIDHVVTSCALVARTDYARVNYLEKLNECQCLKLPNPFYLDGIVGYETIDMARKPSRN